MVAPWQPFVQRHFGHTHRAQYPLIKPPRAARHGILCTIAITVAATVTVTITITITITGTISNTITSSIMITITVSTTSARAITLYPPLYTALLWDF